MPWLRVVAIATWILVVALSLDHVAQLVPALDPPTWLLGALGWTCALSMLALLGRGVLGPLLLVLLLFGALGFASGPFLEPPGDPLEHLRRTWAVCDAPASSLKPVNGGLWHYSMSGVLLCADAFTATPASTLRTIDAVHGLHQALLAGALFLTARAAGLPLRWCGFALLAAFLFFGTNRIAYFRYFSLGPSGTSMAVYWLWIAAFFFRTGRGALLPGALAAATTLPVLWGNHQQEAIFVGLVAGLWIALGLHPVVWSALARLQPRGGGLRRHLAPGLYAAAIVGVLFVAPRLETVRELLASLFVEDHWARNQALVVRLPLLLVGHPWGFRIGDTLGAMGYLPLLLALPVLWPGGTRLPLPRARRVVLLGLLPLLVLLTPLLAFVWISNAKQVVFWRIAYASLFWLPLAAAAARLEGRARRWRGLVLPGCVAALVALATVRSGPFYGKLDFLLVDGRPWWPAWSGIVREVHADPRRQIHADHITSVVVQDVFGVPSFHPVERQGRRALRLDPGYIDPRRMNALNRDDSHHCVINLIGFEPSWVPRETRHWNPAVADTARAYRLEPRAGDPSGLAVLDRLRHCGVFRP